MAGVHISSERALSVMSRVLLSVVAEERILPTFDGARRCNGG